MNAGSPQAEIEISVPLVRRLLAAQSPQWQGLAITPFANGFDNAIFRLGEDMLVRLPRRALAAPLMDYEQQWLTVLAPHLPLPIPAAIFKGQPQDDYPWAWSVTPFLAGEEMARAPADADQAVVMAQFLAALHRCDVPTAPPQNPYRGVAINDRADAIIERLDRLGQQTDLITPAVTRAFDKAMDAPKRDHGLWVHGDLHGRNILTRRGKLAAIIDWGDICSGDPASDLSGLLMAFPDAAQNELVRAALPHLNDDDFAHALGWVVFYGTVLFDTGRIDNPLHATMGQRALAQLDA